MLHERKVRFIIRKKKNYGIFSINSKTFLFQKTLKCKEIETRNCGALQQLADLVDSVSGIGLIVPRLLYEKGLEIPIPSQYTICKPTSRTRSRLSMRSSEAESECNVQSPGDDGLLSKCMVKTVFRLIKSSLHCVFFID